MPASWSWLSPLTATEAWARSSGDDAAGDRVYLASSRVNLQLAEERFPDVKFMETWEVH